jgi:hypothetical protein
MKINFVPFILCFAFLCGYTLQPTFTVEVSRDGTFDLDRKFRAKFVEEDDFDGVWDSFGEER